MRTILALALLTGLALGQSGTFTVAGTATTTSGNVGVSVTSHENPGSHVSTIVNIGGTSTAMELEKGRTLGKLTYYSGKTKNREGLTVKVTMVLGHSEGPSVGVSFSSGSLAGAVSIP